MKKEDFEFGENNEYLSLDFVTCQRSDGTYYGTGGQCRLGHEVTRTSPQGPRRKGYRNPPDMKMVMKASSLDMEAATTKDPKKRERLEERARRIRSELAQALGFTEASFEEFMTEMEMRFDFATCQRADGTTYGTRGDCVQKGARKVSGNVGYSASLRSSANKVTNNHASFDSFKKKVGRLGPDAAKRLLRDLDNIEKVAKAQAKNFINSPDGQISRQRVEKSALEKLDRQQVAIDRMRREVKNHLKKF